MISFVKLSGGIPKKGGCLAEIQDRTNSRGLGGPLILRPLLSLLKLYSSAYVFTIILNYGVVFLIKQAA